MICGDRNGRYRRFYRLHRTPFAGAEDSGDLQKMALGTPSSIDF
jgi:hypothetical protein